MPEYHFHMKDREVEQQKVLELPSVEEARRVSVRLTSEVLIRNQDSLFDHDVCVRVTDPSGLILHEILVLATISPAAMVIR
jgi:hypothetical protein